MNKTATFSPCRKYRYTLFRDWGGFFSSGYAMFIGLNPSTADETVDDPTIRRCIGYANSWGYRGLYMANLFAFRATLPEDMKCAEDPVGPENDYTLITMAEKADVIVAAWGTQGKYMGRDEEVKAMFTQLHCLRLTKNCYPEHPLYLSKGLKPIKYY